MTETAPKAVDSSSQFWVERLPLQGKYCEQPRLGDGSFEEAVKFLVLCSG